MGEGAKRVVCLRRCGAGGPWSGRVEGGHSRWRVDGKCLVDGPLGGSERGGLDDRAGLAGQGDLLQPAGFAADPPPGLLAGPLGDAGQQQRQPAQQHMGADAVLQPVEDGAQQQLGLQVPEAALGLQQVLVAQGDVLGAEVRVGGGQQVFAVQPRLGLDLGAVDCQPPVWLLTQPPAQGGVVTQGALGPQVRGFGLVSGRVAELAGAVTVALAADAGQFGLDAGDRLLAVGLVADRLVGVVADDKSPVGGVQVDFLDPQVVADLLVAALAGQGLVDQVVAVAHAHPGDVVPTRPAQVGQVVGRGEAAVDHGDDPAELPGPQVVFDLGKQGLVLGVAGPAPTPHRDAGPGDRQPDHDLGQVVTVVLGLAVAAEALPASTVAVAVAGLVVVFVVGFEVGRGGVEEQQVDLEVEQVGDG